MKPTSLSPDQKSILYSLIDWIRNPQGQFISVGGYAGTGKTTLIGLLNLILKRTQPDSTIAFASFTGKASQILKNKLLETKKLTKNDFCGTIHSLMYTPTIDKDGRVTNWRRNKDLKFDLIVIDEASMVTQDIWNDLLSYNLPIIAVGDHGQLPPIGDKFNLMQSPHLTLEHVHRQAAESPIITIATMARQHGTIPHQRFSRTILKTSRSDPDTEDIFNRYFNSLSSQTETLVLCGRNKTRVQLNQHIRGLLGINQPTPRVGETVICLKNNYDNTDGPIYNGMIGYLKKIIPQEEHWYQAEVDFPADHRSYTGTISKHQFNQENYIESVDGLHYSQVGDRFDFGYALTVHKAQGSQAETVIIFEERSRYWSDDDWRRWLYTAVTRAQKNLYIFG